MAATQKTAPSAQTAPSQEVSTKELAARVAKQDEGLATLTKSVNGLVDQLSKTPAAGVPHPWAVFGAPGVRKGEDPMSSRGFSFIKMLGLLRGNCSPDDCKIEVGIHQKLHEAFKGDYDYRGAGRVGEHVFLAPLATSHFQEGLIDRSFRKEMKDLVIAGTAGSQDLPDETNWIRRKMLEGAGYQKALSWLDELRGGALVEPAEQGELIELLRNKEALVNAGAKTVPLPAQGRLKYPRQTGASTAYWVGESAPIPDSTPGTGEVTLQGKKLAVRIIAPNELLRFANPAAEALIRDDMTKSLALALDLAGLESAGSDTRPRGIIVHPGINTVASSSVTANGDRLIAADVYRMKAAVEESNVSGECSWVMRPKTLYKFYQLRADAVAQGDSMGPFIFNLVREAGMGTNAMLGGSKVVTSTQVSQVRSKGSSTALTYMLYGDFSEVLIGMFGAIEFAQTTQGDTAFTNDQTWVRGILTADVAIRHEAAFAFMDNLDTTLGNPT